MGKSDHLALGAAGEDAAARFLVARGWRVLARNWRPEGAARGLELDIIARQGDTLVFVEVKTRSRSGTVSGARNPHAEAVPAHAAFTPQKQSRLVRAARRYLSSHGFWDLPCRFDLICVEQEPDGQQALEYYSNVIELGHVVGGGDAPWQPW